MNKVLRNKEERTIGGMFQPALCCLNTAHSQENLSSGVALGWSLRDELWTLRIFYQLSVLLCAWGSSVTWCYLDQILYDDSVIYGEYLCWKTNQSSLQAITFYSGHQSFAAQGSRITCESRSWFKLLGMANGFYWHKKEVSLSTIGRKKLVCLNSRFKACELYLYLIKCK